MPDKIIFKQENEKDFWRYWEQYIHENQISPKYLRTYSEFLLKISKHIYKDKSFVYLQNNKPVACVFLPIEKHDDIVSITIESDGDYVLAPLSDNKKVEKKIFNLIDEIALKNNASKIMFSIDPLEKDRYPYNYLQKYNYLDTSLLLYLISIKEDLLQNCREGCRKLIRSLLKNKDFSTFYINRDSPDYKIHKEYEFLHHKCAGRITRPQETFDIQYQDLKQGNAVLFGLRYKEKNVAYSYFQHHGNKALYFSGADDPDYDKMPLYYLLIYSAMEYYKKKGVDYISVCQPSSPSAQFYYYPDKKELNIAFFKRGFSGDYVESFRGIKYLSKESFEKDMNTFLNKYKI